MTIKRWLKTDYADVLAQINATEAAWKAAGSGERRSWWLVLAGNLDGSTIFVGELEFPVLRAAQIRQERQVTSNALCRNEVEIAPPLRMGRWQKQKRVLPKKTVGRVAKAKAKRVGQRKAS